MRLKIVSTLSVMAVVLGAGLAFAPLTRAEVPASSEQISLSFAPVVKTAAPAVVNIFTTTLVPQRRNPFAGDPFFEQFFQNMDTPTARRPSALGSGVIVSPDGLVISNTHVTEGADQIRVVLNDRREYAARVLLADAASDLTVLQLQDAENLPALTLADSDALQVGDLVLAIGNPFGVGQTVSSGIVSGLARSALQVGNGQGYFVQTDAPINPGNSGGALVNMAGQLVGINTAIVTQGGGSNGIGFAVPSNLVAAVLEQARGGASAFARPWAGLTGQEVNAATAEALGMPLPEGVLIADMDPASPFATAGVQTGDILLTLDGKPVNTPQEMIYRLSTLGTGATVALTWDREGTINAGTVTLIAPPDTPDREALIITDDVVLRGLTLARINPAVRAEMGLPLDAMGVVVTGADDLAARIGLQRGDVLLAINGRAVDRPADALTLAAEPANRWQIEVVRNGQVLRLRFRL